MIIKHVLLEMYCKCDLKKKNQNIVMELGIEVYDLLKIEDIDKRSLFEINVPIVTVLELSDNTCKYNVQCEIQDMLEKKGYKTAFIGSKEYCEFLDEKSFPGFMFNNNISEADKIYYFNSLVKNIEINEKPDIIIIGIPGGTMPFSNTVVNNFGITAFETFQAVRPDFSIRYGLMNFIV